MAYIPLSIINTNITDAAGRKGINMLFGGTAISSKHDYFAVQFQYGVPSVEISGNYTGTGASFQSASMLFLTASAAGAGTAQITTNDVIRYHPAHDAYFYATAVFTPGSASSYQRIGILDDENGFYVGFSGSSFGVAKRKYRNDTFTSQSEFIFDKLDGTGNSGFNYNPTKLNIFRLNFGWLGTAPCVYEILSESGSWIPFHAFWNANQNDGTLIGNPALPGRFEVIKEAGSTPITASMACFVGGVYLNDHHPMPTDRIFGSGSIKTVNSATVPIPIFSIQVTGSYQGKTNKVCAVPCYLAAGTGNSITYVRLYKNATLTGPAFVAVDSNNSVVSFDQTASAMAGGTYLFAMPLASNGNNLIENLEQYDIKLNPGDTITVGATTGGSVAVNVSMMWKELF